MRGRVARVTKEKSRIRELVLRLEEGYPEATCALRHGDPFQLLCATILSAQCTDERVNQVTPELFSRFPGAKELSQASQAELERIIHSTGFFRNKARNLIGAAKKLVAEHDGVVPRTMPELLELPGVARKTANVVLGTAYGIAEGIVVDTHVARLSQRLGLTRHKEPAKIEADLMKKLGRENWISFSHQLILHGRSTCKARKPLCDQCFLPDLCPFYQASQSSFS